MTRTILVTGASRYVGARIVAALARQPAVSHVVAVDVVPAAEDLVPNLASAEFVRADIRNPSIAKVIERSGADTIVHAGVHATPTGSGGRGALKEVNVIGTMQLLAACQKASAVRRLVVKSSTSVYGSSSRDPAVFTEEMPTRAVPRSGYAKDAYEVEAYVRGFARRRSDIEVCTLRFANALGPVVRTPTTDYFALAAPPVPLGFDARLQFIHEDDLVEIITRAALGTITGVVNAAGDGVLTLRQALRRAGRIPVPVPTPASGLVTRVVRGLGLTDFSVEQLAYFAHGRVVDCRRLHDELDYRPAHTTPDTFAEFVAARCQHGPVPAERVDSMSRALRAALAGSDQATHG